MVELPTGTVTFLMTDIEGSTKLWEDEPEAMRSALARHDAVIESLVNECSGVVIRPRGEGDSRFVVFEQVTNALSAAASIQQALFAEAWPTSRPLRVRMALHTGEADLRMGDYYGTTVNRCARLRALAYGGQTLVSGATARLAEDRTLDGVRLESRGEYQLRDLSQPEHVYELILDDLPHEFPPLEGSRRSLSNLPTALTPFVGRERELVEVHDRLETSRLLTLTGSGGTGKTRLALQVAAGLPDDYPDGIWLVELAPLTDPALVPQAVASVLGVRETTQPSLITTLIASLQRKTTLLVIDNCEHLIDACAALVDGILRGCPTIRILATSREALGVAGEVAYPVPSLRLPAPDQPLDVDAAEKYEAIRLFVERAQAAQPRFAVTEATVKPIAQICRRLDGIPLAIELAAARVKALSVEQLLGRLDDRFRLLTGGSRTALPRQQTLRGTIDWSYSLLSEPECVLFRRLSVFAGDWTLEAAEAVCADGDLALHRGGHEALPDPLAVEGPRLIPSEDVLDLLTHLIDKSLVAVDDSGPALRYRFLETIRQYAREKLLEAGEGVIFRNRHLVWFVNDLERVDDLYEETGWLDWIDSLEPDVGNYRAALEWSAESSPALQLRLAAKLGEAWLNRHTRELRHWLVEALAHPANAAPTLNRARALMALGLVRFAQGDNVASRQDFENAQTIFRALGEERYLAYSLGYMGNVMQHESDPDAVLAIAEEALAISTRIDFKIGIAIGSSIQAMAFLSMGRMDEAREALERELEAERRLGDPWWLGSGLIGLSQWAYRAGDYDEARELLDEAIAHYRQTGDKQSVSMLSTSHGDIARRLGNPNEAEAWYEEAIHHSIELGNRGAEASLLLRLGYTMLDLDDRANARAYFESALLLRQELGEIDELAGPLEGFAAVALAESQSDHVPDVQIDRQRLHKRAARLLGAAERLRGPLEMSLDVFDRQLDWVKTETALRASLDAATLAACWDEGAAMTVDEAVAYALGAN